MSICEASDFWGKDEFNKFDDIEEVEELTCTIRPLPHAREWTDSSARLSGPTYANQLVVWKEQPYLIGTVWNDDAGEKTARQDFICDPIPLQFTETGVKAIV